MRRFQRSLCPTRLICFLKRINLFKNTSSKYASFIIKSNKDSDKNNPTVLENNLEENFINCLSNNLKTIKPPTMVNLENVKRMKLENEDLLITKENKTNESYSLENSLNKNSLENNQENINSFENLSNINNQDIKCEYSEDLNTSQNLLNDCNNNILQKIEKDCDLQFSDNIEEKLQDENIINERIDKSCINEIISDKNILKDSNKSICEDNKEEIKNNFINNLNEILEEANSNFTNILEDVSKECFSSNCENINNSKIYEENKNLLGLNTQVEEENIKEEINDNLSNFVEENLTCDKSIILDKKEQVLINENVINRDIANKSIINENLIDENIKDNLSVQSTKDNLIETFNEGSEILLKNNLNIENIKNDILEDLKIDINENSKNDLSKLVEEKDLLDEIEHDNLNDKKDDLTIIKENNSKLIASELNNKNTLIVKENNLSFNTSELKILYENDLSSDNVPRLNRIEMDESLIQLDLVKRLKFSLEELKYEEIIGKAKNFVENLINENFELKENNKLTIERCSYETKRLEECYSGFLSKTVDEFKINLEKKLLKINKIEFEIDELKNKISLTANDINNLKNKNLELKVELEKRNILINELNLKENDLKILIEKANKESEFFKNEALEKSKIIDNFKLKIKEFEKLINLKDGDIEDLKIKELNLLHENKVHFETSSFLTKENQKLLKENEQLEISNKEKLNILILTLKDLKLIKEFIVDVKSQVNLIKENYFNLLSIGCIDFSEIKTNLYNYKNKILKIQNTYDEIYNKIINEKELVISEFEKEKLEFININKNLENEIKKLNLELEKFLLIKKELLEEIEIKNKYILDLEKNVIENQKNADFYQKQLVAADLVISELKSSRIGVDAVNEIARIRKKHAREIASLKLRIEELENDL